MKIWPWGSNPDYAIKVEQGTKGKWRWSLVFQGSTVALSPVKPLGIAPRTRGQPATRCWTASARNTSTVTTNERRTEAADAHHAALLPCWSPAG